MKIKRYAAIVGACSREPAHGRYGNEYHRIDYEERTDGDLYRVADIEAACKEASEEEIRRRFDDGFHAFKHRGTRIEAFIAGYRAAQQAIRARLGVE